VPLPRRNPDGTKAEPSAYLVKFLRDLVEDDVVPGTTSSDNN
jgi:hypothetical protein